MYVHREAVHNLRAPRVIVPDLVADLHPHSVVDVGCGIGTFLSVFLENDVTDLLGLDGPWVDRNKLHIDRQFFLEADLADPPSIERTFDIALCLEVAEHLKPEDADKLVAFLCALSRTIVFSAALPGQGGTNHLNEQLAEYWQEKFQQNGYHFFDIFRERYWHSKEVDWWYKQNMFLIAHESTQMPPQISEKRVIGRVNTFVHPDLYLHTARELGRMRSNVKSLKSISGLVRSVRKLVGNRTSKP